MRKTNLVFFVFFFFLLFLNSVRADTAAVPFYIEDFNTEWIKINWTYDDNTNWDLKVDGYLVKTNLSVFIQSLSSKNQTIPTTTWINITFDTQEDNLKKNISHTHNDSSNVSFFIGIAGLYKINYKYQMQDTAINSHVVARVMRNGIEIDDSGSEIDPVKQNGDILLTRNYFYVNLDKGDRINFEIYSSGATITLKMDGTGGVRKYPVSINIEKVS